MVYSNPARKTGLDTTFTHFCNVKTRYYMPKILIIKTTDDVVVTSDIIVCIILLLPLL
jgi:hypothetical protein